LHSARCCSGSQVFVTRITTDESVSRSTYPPSSLCPGSRRVPTTPKRHDSAHMLRVISAAWTLRKHERKWAGTALFGLCDGAEEKAMRADAGRIRAYLIKSSLSQDDPQELMCTSTNGLAKFLSQEGSTSLICSIGPCGVTASQAMRTRPLPPSTTTYPRAPAQPCSHLLRI
jgi:hypothetical protein